MSLHSTLTKVADEDSVPLKVSGGETMCGTQDKPKKVQALTLETVPSPYCVSVCERKREEESDGLNSKTNSG